MQFNKNNKNIQKVIDVLKTYNIAVKDMFVRDYWGNETKVATNTVDFSKYATGDGEEANDVQLILRK